MSRPNEPPLYKGEPLDAERGPGLGCFWIQIGLLTFFLVLTPLTVIWAWDPFVSGALLIFTLVLLLFAGQTVIFLLRLVAADRRTRRAPLDPGASRTVGQLQDGGAVVRDEGAAVVRDEGATVVRDEGGRDMADDAEPADRMASGLAAGGRDNTPAPVDETDAPQTGHTRTPTDDGPGPGGD